jgi:excisionase family DNA binding protein
MEETNRPKIYTLKEVAEWLGVSPRTLKKHIHSGICHYHKIGSNYFFTEECLHILLSNTKTRSLCQNEIVVPGLNGLISEDVITSSGRKMVAAASAARALEIGQKLKKGSLSSSSIEQPLKARVVPMTR